ncbi:type I methionyl aminopeptidase [Desulfonatronum thioautotrophicum]|uniref:type I methionyl aminopeptidase n=1 Tax=Desulfonatronum thioautotrophicum TaxID=617001 RepID=UPI0005EB84E3|nr:type I methionyl aminopeptidase [Desulfonatronum thioautotrophicum]
MKKYLGIYLKNEKEINILREANRIVSTILDALQESVRPGIKTMDLEEIALTWCSRYDVKPAFKGYRGFPYAICCSVNEQVVHGFPSERELREGDIVSIDFGVIYQGFYGDSARTFPVGQISTQSQRLLDVTRNALDIGIQAATVGNQLHDISRAIQQYVEKEGCAVVKRFVGHGIGRSLHEKPEIPNFIPQRYTDIPLKTGMVLAIEPMVTAGNDEVEILPDRWTAVTKDQSLAAHFEHTIALTSKGPEVLSKSFAEYGQGRVQ